MASSGNRPLKLSPVEKAMAKMQKAEKSSRLNHSSVVFEENVHLRIPAVFDGDERKRIWLHDMAISIHEKPENLDLVAVFVLLSPHHHIELVREFFFENSFSTLFESCDKIPMSRLSEIALESASLQNAEFICGKNGLQREIVTEDSLDSLLKTMKTQMKKISGLSETVYLLSTQQDEMNAKLDSLSVLKKGPSLLPTASSVSVQTDELPLHPPSEITEGSSNSHSDDLIDDLNDDLNVCCLKDFRKPNVKAKTPSNPCDFAQRMARVRGLHVNPRSGTGSEGYSSAASSYSLKKRTWRFRGIEFGFPDGSRLPTFVKMRNGCHCYRCGLKTHLRNDCDALALDPQTKWPYDSSLQYNYRAIKQLQSRRCGNIVGPHPRSPPNCNRSVILSCPPMMPCPPFVRSGPGIMPGARWSTPMFVCATSPFRPRAGTGGRW